MGGCHGESKHRSTAIVKRGWMEGWSEGAVIWSEADASILGCGEMGWECRSYRSLAPAPRLTPSRESHL